MTWLRAALCLLVMAESAQALSCARPSVETSYARASASEHEYIIAQGQLVFDEGGLPKAQVGEAGGPKETRLLAQLSGLVMSAQGFDQSIQRQISLVLGCFGPWCGSLASGEDYLLFLRKEANELLLKRSAKNLRHSFWRDAAQGMNASRASPISDVSG